MSVFVYSLSVCVKEAEFTLCYFGLELEAGGNGATGESLER